MSKNTTVVVVIIVVILIGAGIWYAVASQLAPMAQMTATNPSSSAQATQAPVASSTPEAGLTTSSGDTSNAAITNDFGSVDTQMNGLNSDSAAANQNQ